MKSSLLSTTENPFRREIIVFLLIQVAAFAVYFQALAYGFLTTWDDPVYVVNNVAAHGFSWEHVKTAFTRFYVGNYAPLHIVSYMLDYTLWGLNPAGYIFHNIVLHALNGYLLYLLLLRFSTALYPSVFAALLFVVHPVQVESVVWISQRKNVLAMLFFLLSFYFYSCFRKESVGASRKHYALSLLFFACSLLAKSVTVVLPAILFLYDFCIDRRKLLKSIPDKLPFIAFAGIVSFIALLSQSEEYGGGGRTDLHGGGAWSTLLTMLPVFISYARMVLVPAGLSIVYSPQIKTGFDADVLFSFLIICFLSVAGYFLYRRNRVLFFWYAFIPLAILPVSQLIPIVTLINDRYLYFPMLGVAACFGFLVQHLSAKSAGRWTGVLSACFLLIVVIYGVASFQRASVWKNALVLWQDAAEKQPDSAVAWFVLGDIYGKQGDPVSAVKLMERSLDVCRGVECYHSLEKLSALYLQLERFDEAEKSADELIRLFPKSANGYILKGYLKYQQSRLPEAEQLFLEGLKLDSNQQSSLIALGNIYLVTGRPVLAKEKLEAAYNLGNPTAELYYSMACAESLLQNRTVALNYLEQALRLGYNKRKQILKSAELSYLKELPEFAGLMQSYFPRTDSPGNKRNR